MVQFHFYSEHYWEFGLGSQIIWVAYFLSGSVLSCIFLLYIICEYISLRVYIFEYLLIWYYTTEQHSKIEDEKNNFRLQDNNKKPKMQEKK